MTKKLEELEAIYCSEKIRWDETALIDCELPRPAGQQSIFEIPKHITIKVKAEEDELRSSLSYRFYGNYQDYENKYLGLTERQFVAKTFVRCQPHGQQGTVRYLLQAPNVGQAVAQKLWLKFAGDAVRILRETPDVAAAAVDVRGFTPEKASEAAEFLRHESALEACTIDLIDLLGGKQFPRDTAKKAVKKWGNQAANIIRKLPYRLMRFRGCSFLRTDNLYMELGHRADWIGRQAACAWYVVAKNTEGHTWFPPDYVEKGDGGRNRGLRGMVGARNCDPVGAIKLARRAGILSTRRDADGKLWIAESKNATAEANVARIVVEKMQAPGQWPDPDELDISDHQRDELKKCFACAGQIAILSGRPGTGKTYTAARIIKSLQQAHGLDSVMVCAPTGKAAVRISEMMAGYDIDIQAKTIHGLLGVASKEEGEGWGFKHNERFPLDYRYVATDETSMEDVNLASSHLSACGPGTHVLLIGDDCQLAPVGNGAPFRDLKAAGVPCCELTEIRRNSGSIVKACSDIVTKKRFDVDTHLDPDTGKNLVLLHERTSEGIITRIIETLKKLRDRKICDAVWEVQIICALNNVSEVARKKLNKRLQAELNPDGRSSIGIEFRHGDKIVCLKNKDVKVEGDSDEDEDIEDDEDEPEFRVCNGELGRVTDVSKHFVLSKFETIPGEIKIIFGKQDAKEEDEKDHGDEDKDAGAGGSDFDLGYAISCHKSQGSEWPIVMVVLDDHYAARGICTREWLYTAISRARTACMLVGKKSTADSMLLRSGIGKRKTFLKELIIEKLQATERAVQ